MNLLVTNDDGIGAEGIKELVDALHEVADVYVCAPNTERSACGHGITIHNTIMVEEAEFENAKAAFAIHGTPADCVKIGLELFESKGIEIDMVFSGINMGGNLGTDVLYSGTVSAAIEGAMCGKLSVAVSVNSHHPKDYGMAKKLAAKAAVMDHTNLREKTILNINVPNLAEDEILGVKVTGLGVREYEEWFKKVENDDGYTHYQYGGRPVLRDDYKSDTNDVGASQAKYATVTPLHYDLTDYNLMKAMKEKEGIWNE